MKSDDQTDKQKNNTSPFSHYKTMAEDDVALQILNIIEQNPSVSQRKITVRTGIAAGLVHSFMSRVINKGWVRAKQVSAKRWLYFLTPKGFLEKSSLSMNYLSSTLGMYRKAQNLIKEQLTVCQVNNWNKLLVVGDNELAEIAALNIQAADGFTLVGTITRSPAAEVAGNQNLLTYKEINTIEYDKIWVCEANFMEWCREAGYPVDEKRLVHIIDSMIMNNNQS